MNIRPTTLPGTVKTIQNATSTEMRADIIQRRRDGQSVKYISDMTCVSMDRVRRILRNAGL